MQVQTHECMAWVVPTTRLPDSSSQKIGHLCNQCTAKRAGTPLPQSRVKCLANVDVNANRAWRWLGPTAARLQQPWFPSLLSPGWCTVPAHVLSHKSALFQFPYLHGHLYPTVQGCTQQHHHQCLPAAACCLWFLLLLANMSSGCMPPLRFASPCSARLRAIRPWLFIPRTISHSGSKPV